MLKIFSVRLLADHQWESCQLGNMWMEKLLDGL